MSRNSQEHREIDNSASPDSGVGQIEELKRLKSEGRYQAESRGGLNSLQKLVAAGMLAALTTVATLLVQIPTPSRGFLNMGDVVVLVSAWVLGPVYGAAAAGIGSMLADLIAGYTMFAPGTLIIKGLVALIAAALFAALKFKGNGGRILARLISGTVGELFMVFGYFIYEAVILGMGPGALAGVPGNLGQGAFGLIAGFVVITLLERHPYIRSRLPA
ncbi:MAG: ECF transporter S component [Saccharofermentanales bacterium]|nr:ECF transporter S component [Bacillota bacterium]